MRGQSQFQRVLRAPDNGPQRVAVDCVRLLEALLRRPVVLGQVADVPVRHNRVVHVVPEDAVPGHQIKRITKTHLGERVRDVRVVALLPEEHVENLIVIRRQVC